MYNMQTAAALRTTHEKARTQAIHARIEVIFTPCYLEEEAEVLVSLFLPEKASYKADSLSQLTPELVDQLLEHFVDPVHGSPSRNRKAVRVMNLHVDDLIIGGTPKFLSWFLEKIKKSFTVGHEDKNDLTFTGQRVRWVFEEIHFNRPATQCVRARRDHVAEEPQGHSCL